MSIRRSLLGFLLLGVAAFSSQAIAADRTGELEELGKSYVAAQFEFDQQAIARMTAEQFVEISPKGEVDERAAVLDFYAPDKRRPAPPYHVSQSRVRVTGASAVITQIVTIGQAPRSMSLSQLLVATRVGDEWLLVSSQSTPLPPAPPAT
jgi:hypothetical protein